MPDYGPNPFMPEVLRGMLPMPSDDMGQTRDAVTKMLKPDRIGATWECPDCGAQVQPRPIGRRWLPRAFCSCPGGTNRMQQSRIRWADQDREDTEKIKRYRMLEACDLVGTGMTFDSWQADTPARKRAEAFGRRMVQKLAQGQWAFWWGPYGCGKTHMAHSVASALIMEHGRGARVINWLRQLREIQQSWSDNTKETPLWNAMLKTPVLFLDDFDKQLPRPSDLDKPHIKLPSSWYMESLYWIIDERYANNRPTVLIANQSYHDTETVLQAIGGTAVDAVLSRFNRNGAIKLDWATTGVTEYTKSGNHDRPLF